VIGQPFPNSGMSQKMEGPALLCGQLEWRKGRYWNILFLMLSSFDVRSCRQAIADRLTQRTAYIYFRKIFHIFFRMLLRTSAKKTYFLLTTVAA
jgi:hypothetical protein